MKATRQGKERLTEILKRQRREIASPLFCSKVGRLVGARETREGDFAAEIDRADQKISPFWII